MGGEGWSEMGVGGREKSERKGKCASRPSALNSSSAMTNTGISKEDSSIKINGLQYIRGVYCHTASFS